MNQAASTINEDDYVDDDIVAAWVRDTHRADFMACSGAQQDTWRERFYSERNGLPATGPALPSYGFDLELKCSLHVKAPSHEAALRILRDKLDCADSNLGAWDDGTPILAEVSLRGTPALYERNDEPMNVRPPIVFEPGHAELARVLEHAWTALEGEEDSVRDEHRNLLGLMRATLNALTDMSRKSELSAFLRLLHRDTDKDDTPYLSWVADLARNPDGYGYAQAVEYLSLK